MEEENIKKIKEIKDHIEVNASDQDEYEEMAIQEEKWNLNSMVWFIFVLSEIFFFLD